MPAAVPFWMPASMVEELRASTPKPKAAPAPAPAPAATNVDTALAPLAIVTLGAVSVLALLAGVTNPKPAKSAPPTVRTLGLHSMHSVCSVRSC